MTCDSLKVGGLGDVLTGLSRALQRKGHLVEVILPKYDCMDYSRITNLKVSCITSEPASYLNSKRLILFEKFADLVSRVNVVVAASWMITLMPNFFWFLWSIFWRA